MISNDINFTAYRKLLTTANSMLFHFNPCSHCRLLLFTCEYFR